jgi:hypothetical protein
MRRPGHATRQGAAPEGALAKTRLGPIALTLQAALDTKAGQVDAGDRAAGAAGGAATEQAPKQPDTR